MHDEHTLNFLSESPSAKHNRELRVRRGNVKVNPWCSVAHFQYLQTGYLCCRLWSHGGSPKQPLLSNFAKGGARLRHRVHWRVRTTFRACADPRISQRKRAHICSARLRTHQERDLNGVPAIVNTAAVSIPRITARVSLAFGTYERLAWLNDVPFPARRCEGLVLCVPFHLKLGCISPVTITP